METRRGLVVGMMLLFFGRDERLVGEWKRREERRGGRAGWHVS